MKINAAFTVKPRIRPKVQIKTNIQKKILLLSALDIAIGIVLGTVLFVTNNKYMSGELVKYFIDFETNFSGKNFAEIFFGFLAVNLVYAALVVVFGASAIGELPIILMTLVKAVGIGSLASYLFSGYGLKGLEYFMLILFPGKVVMLLSIMLLMQNSLLSSHQIRQVVKGNSSDYVNVRLYLMRTLLILVFFAAAGLVDACMVKLFSPLFEF